MPSQAEARLKKALSDCHAAAEEQTSRYGEESVAQTRMNSLPLDLRVLEERLLLEVSMRYMITRMPFSCFSVVAFLTAMFFIHPVGTISRAHQHIISHYDLDGDILNGITNATGIYNFVAHFEDRNALLQPTSWRYFCEDRYYEHHWDTVLQVPVKTCNSPRYYSLALMTNDEAKWSTWTQMHEMSEASQSCSDDDQAFMAYTGAPVPCAESVPGVCESSLGLRYCQATCGYCPLFTYKRYHKFKQAQLSILPTFVHQTRRGTKDCREFSEYYNNQAHNQDLSYLPALDGPRAGYTLLCVDVGKRVDDDYAQRLECPADATTAMCAEGYVEFSRVSQYKGEAIYPIILGEPARSIEAMKQSGWIDVQTDLVTVSAIVFTSSLAADVYTSLKVEFHFTLSGKIDIRRRLKSIPDLKGRRTVQFGTCLGISIVCELIATVLAIRSMYAKQFSTGFHAMELIATVSFLCFGVGMVLVYALLPDVQGIVINLTEDFLSLDSTSNEAFWTAIDNYYKTKEKFATDVQWLNALNVVAVLILYLQFVKLLLYSGLHPRVGNVMLVIIFAGDHLLHLFLVFAWLFLFLAVISSWTLGSEVESLRDISTTIAAQFRMLFGMELDGEMFRHFDSSTMVMFQVYYLSFLFFMFFMFVNLFVAIMVDALVKVKREDSTKLADRNFIVDLCDAFYSWSLYRRYEWPPLKKMVRVLEECVEVEVERQDQENDEDEDDSEVKQEKGAADCDKQKASYLHAVDSAKEFCNAVPGEFKNFPAFLAHYLRKCGAILAEDEAQAKEFAPRTSHAAQGVAETLGTPSAADMRHELVKVRADSKVAKAHYREVVMQLKRERIQAEKIRQQIWMELHELQNIYGISLDIDLDMDSKPASLASVQDAEQEADNLRRMASSGTKPRRLPPPEDDTRGGAPPRPRKLGRSAEDGDLDVAASRQRRRSDSPRDDDRRRRPSRRQDRRDDGVLGKDNKPKYDQDDQGMKLRRNQRPSDGSRERIRQQRREEASRHMSERRRGDGRQKERRDGAAPSSPPFLGRDTPLPPTSSSSRVQESYRRPNSEGRSDVE